MKLFKPRGKNKLQNDRIPDTSGVYLLWSKYELLYIGQSKNLRIRIAQHFGNGYLQQHQVNPREVWLVGIILTKDEFDALRLEKQLLTLFSTKNNSYKNWFCNSVDKEMIRKMWDD